MSAPADTACLAYTTSIVKRSRRCSNAMIATSQRSHVQSMKPPGTQLAALCASPGFGQDLNTKLKLSDESRLSCWRLSRTMQSVRAPLNASRCQPNPRFNEAVRVSGGFYKSALPHVQPCLAWVEPMLWHPPETQKKFQTSELEQERGDKFDSQPDELIDDRGLDAAHQYRATEPVAKMETNSSKRQAVRTR